MKNQKEFNLFLEVARVFNERKIRPTLFGSLGLMRIVGEFKKAEDVDILIEDEIIDNNYLEIVDLMNQLNFKKIKDDLEFERDGVEVGIMKLDECSKKFSLSYYDLKNTEHKGAAFKEFLAKDYLIFYKKMLENKERYPKKGKADEEKIKIIEDYLKNNLF